MKYVLDTNIISALLRGNANIKQRIESITITGNKIVINAICYYEVKRGLLDANATTQIKHFDKFCETFGLTLLDRKQIFEEASYLYANLKKQGKLINDADILIASSTKIDEYTLVTNDSDFQRVVGLKVENWLD